MYLYWIFGLWFFFIISSIYLTFTHVYCDLLGRFFRVTHSCAFVSYHNFPLFFLITQRMCLWIVRGNCPSRLGELRTRIPINLPSHIFYPRLLCPQPTSYIA